MAEFGWAYIEGGAITSSLGPTGSIQFKIGNQEISGSDRFTFLTASNTVHISGTLTVSGTISASNYVIDNVHVIDSSGSTTFGESNDDIHARTGSFIIASASGAPGSAGTAILSASISTVDGRSFVYASQLAVNKTPRLFIPSASIEWEGYASGSSLFLDSDLRVSGGVTLGDASTDVITIVGTATSSAESLYNNNIQIIDDKKLFFGTGRDASFEYDENGTDRLLYAGANLRISDDVKLEFGTGGDASFEYDENGTDTVLYTGASLRFTDDVKLEFGTGGSSSIEFNGNGDDYLIISGTTSGVAISGTNVVIDGAATFKGNTTLGNAATDVVTSTAQLTASEGATFSKVVRATSGLIVQGGVITGSGQLQAASVDVDGIVDGGGGISVGGTSVISSGRSLQNIVNVSADSLSGSEAIINGVMNVSGNITMGAASTNVTTMVSQFTGSEGASFSKNVTVLDDKKLFFGTNGDGYLEYNEDGDNAFIISGSKTTGLVLSGTNLVVATTAGMTVNDDVFILDDNKLHFGTNTDGYIEYDEAGNNYINISGSAEGLAMSGTNIHVDAQNLYLKNLTSNRPRLYIQNENADANAGQLIFHKSSSSPANNDVIGQVVFQSYDAGGAATVYGSMAGEIKTFAAGGERGRVKISVAELDGTLTEGFTVQGANVDGQVDVTIPAGNLTIVDDRKLQFGTNLDGYIEYNEDGDNALIISGSATTGLVLSGNVYVPNVVSGTAAGVNSLLAVTATGKIVLTGSSGGGGSGTPGGADTQIQYNNDGAFAGIAVFVWDDTDLKIADDTKLHFGTNTDSYVEYDEAGNNYLNISGSAEGMALSGTNIHADAQNFYLKNSIGNRPRLFIQAENADANAGQLIFNKTSSSPANNDVIGSVVFQSYDAGGAATVYGSMVGEIKTFAAGGERGRIKFNIAEYDGTLTEALTLQGANVDGQVDVTVAAGNLTLVDDRKLQFGNSFDGYIEYNEDGDNALIISGSATTGLVLSGTNLIVATTAGMTVTNNVNVLDDKKLYFGTNSDGYIEYNEDGDNALIISGSATTGLVLSGTNLVVDTTAGMTVTDDVFILDDKKLYFGTNNDGYIEYNEDNDNALIISGSATTGLVLSGTNVIVNSTAGMKLKAGSLQLADLGTAGATPASNFGGLYVNADKIYFIDDGGTSVQLGSAGAGTNNTWTGTNTFNDALTAGNELTASNGIDIEGGVIYKVAEKTANFTAASTDYMFLCNVTGAVITGTLPTAVGRAGQTYIFKDVSGSAAANNIVITGSVALQTIDGANEVKITSNSGSVSIMSNGTYWYIIGTS